MSGYRSGGRGRLRAPGSLRDPGRLSAPGSLADTPAAGDEAPAAWADGLAGSGGESLAALAARHGLQPSAARPPILDYMRQLWQRRYFISGFATAKNVALYTEAKLGQVWQVLTPLLNVAVYFLIFGLILGTSRGVYNFLAFLVIGVFVFNFTQRAFLTSSRVMIDSLELIRALHFPRACLPLGYVLIELQQLVISMIVIGATVLLSHNEPLSWYWLLVIPVLVMQTLFNVGASFILARVGAGFDDVSQLLPFVVRTWFYASGVMFSIQTFTNLAKHAKIATALQFNPAAIYITLAREALMRTQRLGMPGTKPYSPRLCHLYHLHGAVYPTTIDSAYCHGVATTPELWIAGAAWAVVVLVAGFVFFWRAEVRYGRGG